MKCTENKAMTKTEDETEGNNDRKSEKRKWYNDQYAISGHKKIERIQ